MKAADLKKRNKPPTVLLYGPAGSGKTALVSQAAGGYLFDFDCGMRTALYDEETQTGINDKFRPLREQIEFDEYVDMPTVENQIVKLSSSVYVNARRKLLDIASQVSAGTWPFDAVVIDSLTGLCRAAQLHVLSCAGNAFMQPQIQHYGMMVNAVESVLTILRSLNVLTLVTAHEMLVETSTGVLIRIMSATRPHGMNKLQWLFDEVLHTQVRAKGQGLTDYIVSGRSTSSVLTRTRSGITGDIVHNDTGLVGLLKRMGYTYKPKL